MKKIRRLINFLVLSLAGLYLGLFLLLNIPAVKGHLGSIASSVLSEKLGTNVEIRKVDVGLFNRLMLDDVLVYDQHQKRMLASSRISVNLDVIELIRNRGHISISSAQLFGLEATLYKTTKDSPLNCQFIIDSLSSKDTTTHTPLNLDIASLIIRNGKVCYDQLDAPRTQGQVSLNHIALSDISTHIMLDQLTDDSLRLNVKNMSFVEQSGFRMNGLSFSFAGGLKNATLRNFKLSMPGTSVDIPLVAASYNIRNKHFEKESLEYSAKINSSTVNLCDLSTLLPKFKAMDNPVVMAANISGNLHEVQFTGLSLNESDNLIANLDASLPFSSSGHWSADIRQLSTEVNYVSHLLSILQINAKIPVGVEKLGKVSIVAKGDGEGLTVANIQGEAKTSLGQVMAKLSKKNSYVSITAETPGFNLAEVLNDKKFGNITGNIDANGEFSGNGFQGLRSLKAKADIKNFEYNSCRYNTISVDGVYNAGHDIAGKAVIEGQAIDAIIDGNYRLDGSHTVVDAQIKRFSPGDMRLPFLNITGEYSGNITADVSGRELKAMKGFANINNLKIKTRDIDYSLSHLYVSKEGSGSHQEIKIRSDFGYVNAEGDFDYSTLFSSISSALAQHIPTLPGLPPYKKNNNKVTVTAQITDTEWAQTFFNLPFYIQRPVSLLADIDDSHRYVDIALEMPQFEFKDNVFSNGYMHIYNAEDSLKAFVNVDIPRAEGANNHFNVKANAFDNHLTTRIDFDSYGAQKINGSVNTEAFFYRNPLDKPEASVRIMPSTIMLNDSIWNIVSSNIIYSEGNLDVSNLGINHNDQYIVVNGSVTEDNDDDYIAVDLNDVNVESILGLVKFESVKFEGNAFGKAFVHNIFGKPLITADLMVKDFKFENGHFGDLYAKANWETSEGDIIIDAIARDTDDRNTVINGFISPRNSGLDLDIQVNGTCLDFVKTYTYTFLDDINLHGQGRVRVYGPFKHIDLGGSASVYGSVRVPPLNTTYTLRGDSILLLPGDIYFANDTVYDKYGNMGIANGHLNHNSFKNITYGFDIDAKNLLGFDTHTFGSDTFYGTALVTGSCFIKGKAGETLIDITGTPCPGTKFVYNASSPDAISNADFVHWNDRNSYDDDMEEDDSNKEFRSDLKINFDINATPDLTLELLMDESNGDYISLNGTGNILANYYNKGAFNMIGNYLVDHGTYRLTVQNIIRRFFEFQPGGTIGFNGDAYDAKLNLQAMYPVNGVSLSDINIGKSFTNNNIRVNCLMDITGTPFEPKIDFSFDMPTVSSDIKSMINSVVNSEEEMNQQVLYLLAVGRFYNPGNNFDGNMDARQSQTSLAMQSILSGTISQQLSNILGDVVGNNNWNFGANISTGDEGFMNAEYEGLISGRMLNDRLLLNGQFGYRDNPNATTSFIGDFDLRYLLVPNGNAAIKMYNQTNDKYFTKNSLNTQGIGLILKKDFTSWRELLPFLK